QQEQWAYLSTHPSKHLHSFCFDDDDEGYTSAITPNEPILSTEEPDNSLSMGDEHLDTISATESDEFIKFGVENLIPIPSESEGIPKHKCDVPFHDNSPPLDDDQSCSDEDVLEKIISKPLCEEEIIPMKSLRTRDSSLSISSKIDSLLEEFVGIDETDCYHEEDIRLIKRLLYDNSSPRPPEEFVFENSNADIESFFPSPISNEDREIS
nr:hypothetical protein [Tanacetum cinerariifolium]